MPFVAGIKGVLQETHKFKSDTVHGGTVHRGWVALPDNPAGTCWNLVQVPIGSNIFHSLENLA